MKVKKLGIEWGAAYEEAQPHIVTHEDSDGFEFYVNERHEIVLDLPVKFEVAVRHNGKVRITLAG